MSTLVAVEKNGRVALAWDSLTTLGSTRSVNRVSPPKVLEVGPAWLGHAGLAVYGNLLDHYLAGKKQRPNLSNERAILSFFVGFTRALREKYHFEGKPGGGDNDDNSPFLDLDADFVIVGPGGIFDVTGNLTVARFERFYATGSGAPQAEGALHVLYDQFDGAEEIARRAVEAALVFDASSGPPVHAVTATLRRRGGSPRKAGPRKKR